MMDRVTVRYVRFFAPGSFFANDWTKPVETLDPQAVEWPDNAYAFSLHQRADVCDGPDTYTGKSEQVGPVYYHPDSRIATLAEVMAAARHDDRILISNMRCNKWDAVVYSRWGNWPQPFEPGKQEILKPAATAGDGNG